MLIDHALGSFNFFDCWQRFEQYITSLHTFRHFLRQLNGLSQTGHCFCGKL